MAVPQRSSAGGREQGKPTNAALARQAKPALPCAYSLPPDAPQSILVRGAPGPSPLLRVVTQRRQATRAAAPTVHAGAARREMDRAPVTDCSRRNAASGSQGAAQRPCSQTCLRTRTRPVRAFVAKAASPSDVFGSVRDRSVSAGQARQRTAHRGRRPSPFPSMDAHLRRTSENQGGGFAAAQLPNPLARAIGANVSARFRRPARFNIVRADDQRARHALP